MSTPYLVYRLSTDWLLENHDAEVARPVESELQQLRSDLQCHSFVAFWQTD